MKFSPFFITLFLPTTSFQPTPQNHRHSTAQKGIFDKFIESMEAGYKGEDSAFQKQKAADEAKRLEQKRRADDRKKRGFTELKDVRKRTFTKLQYDGADDDEEEDKNKKKLFGLFWRRDNVSLSRGVVMIASDRD